MLWCDSVCDISVWDCHIFYNRPINQNCSSWADILSLHYLITQSFFWQQHYFQQPCQCWTIPEICVNPGQNLSVKFDKSPLSCTKVSANTKVCTALIIIMTRKKLGILFPLHLVSDAPVIYFQSTQMNFLHFQNLMDCRHGRTLLEKSSN